MSDTPTSGGNPGASPEDLRAAQEQRNVLERLIDKIPGFRGYQNRELRRDVDRLHREHLAREIEALKVTVRARARGYTDAGQIESLTRFDRLDRTLDGLSQGVRFADYGYSGLFDAVKIGEQELEALHRFDLAMVDELEAFAADVAAIPAPGAGNDALQPALEQAESRLTAIEARWSERETVIQSVVRGSALPASDSAPAS